MKTTTRLFFAVTILSVAVVHSANARVKLVALPDRDMTTLKMDHATLTLVTEERDLQLQKGINRIDFSWKGVQLDPDTIRLELQNASGAVNVLSVSYPPNEQALTWEVFADKAKTQTAQISYVLHDIDKQIHYAGQLIKSEKNMTLSQHLVLRNFSGEDYANASIDLGHGERIPVATESGETKRMLAMQYDDVKVEKVYVFDAAVMPWEPEKADYTVGIPMFYQWENNSDHKLGTHYLPQGKMRMFQSEGGKNVLFNGEGQLDNTPVGKRSRLLANESRDLKVTQKKLASKRENIIKNRNNTMVMWDELSDYEVVIQSFKAQAATLELLEPMSGEWEVLDSSHDFRRVSVSQAEFHVTVPANETVTLTYRVVQKHVR